MRDPLGEALERDVPAAERHGRGQYFTPDALVDLVLGLLPSPPPGARVLDPACGAGRFLLAAGERWRRPQLFGFETDHEALVAARAQLPDATVIDADFLESAGTGEMSLVVGNPPYVRSRGNKQDLYVRFVRHGLEHLQQGGRLAFVLSNAWLDVGYGQQMRELLLDGAAIEWVVESASERWFPGASVNTMILVVRRGAPEPGHVVRFAEVREPLPATPTVVRAVPQSELPRERAWGPLLRASDRFLEVRQRCVPLGELAEVSRGWTTNDNRFFYPPADAGIEPSWLRPLAKGPKRLRGVRFSADELQDRAFVCDALPLWLTPGARAWIEKRGRTEWALQPQEPARLFVVKGTHNRHRHPLADAPVQADQQLYLVRPKDDIEEEALAALLNSSWSHLCLELGGRVNFGDGVLWLGLEDARRRLWLPDVRGDAHAAHRHALAAAFRALPDGPVPPAAQLDDAPAWSAAIDHLDGLVGHLLGLDDQAQRAVRHEWRALCARRLRLAASAR